MSTPTAPRPRPVTAVTIGLCLCLVLFYGVIGAQLIPSAKLHDFGWQYSIGHLVRAGELSRIYQIDRQQAAWDQLYGPGTSAWPFLRPPFLLPLNTAISYLPIGQAFLVYGALMAALWLAVQWFLARQWGESGLLLAALALPAPLSIAAGQDAAIMMAAVAGSLLLERRGCTFAAGGMLALALLKWHVILLAPLALLVARRYRLLAGFCAVGLVLALVSLAAVGPGGVRDYAQVLLRADAPNLTPSPTRMTSLVGLLRSLGLPESPLVHLLRLAAAAAALWAARGGPYWRTLLAGLTGSLLVTPHSYGYDASMLLAPLVFASQAALTPRVRTLATIACTPLPFLCVLLNEPWTAVPSAMLCLLLALLALEPLTAPAGGTAAFATPVHG